MNLKVLKHNSEEAKRKINRLEQLVLEDSEQQSVRAILDAIKTDGLPAVQEYRNKFDRINSTLAKVTSVELEAAAKLCSDQVSQAILISIDNVRKYHAAQLPEVKQIETYSGVSCWRKAQAIESVGLYVPGGSAPLFSSLIMLAVPAKLAGCKRIVVCTPPDSESQLNPQIAFIARQLELAEIYLIGGAQAVGLMAYGAQNTEKVDKIFGPGNRYVTLAKQIVASQGTAIDMPAGPSEVLVIADQSAKPDFVALDLLSQAEHGADSQVILISDSTEIIDQINIAIEKILPTLNRKHIILASLENSCAILTENLEQAIEFSNLYAPEHLILASDNARQLSEQVTNAGSVFIGNYSAEVFGDYISGPNHTLPTAGFAKTTSGVNIESFMKYISFQSLSRQAAKDLAEPTSLLASAEGLQAHALAAKIRSEY